MNTTNNGIQNEEDPGFSVKPAHNVLYVELSGSWNHEKTCDYAIEYKKQVSRYFAREWACVLNLQNLEMLISEQSQIEMFRALNSWSYIKGMTAQAVVISIENRHHLLYQFEEVFNETQPFEMSIFYSEPEANSWLKSLGHIRSVETSSQRIA
jgi:hypothetical protein